MLEFYRECGDVIALSPTPLLKSNCSATFKNAGLTIHNYTAKSQAVASVVVSSNTLKLYTNPNTLAGE